MRLAALVKDIGCTFLIFESNWLAQKLRASLTQTESGLNAKRLIANLIF
jgi:hypothetical protein